MKKRILSMLLVATMVMGIFTGCGAGGSANEITVSEMLNSILEENGEVVMYTFDKDGNKWTEDYSPSKNTEMMVYYYDGKTVTAMRSKDMKLSGYLDGTSEINIKGTAIQNVPVTLTLVNASDGKDVRVESLISDEKVAGISKQEVASFGEFSRKEINGVSCMIFATYSYKDNSQKLGDVYDKLSSVQYVIIKDTEFTKDKTIVFDSSNSETVKVIDEEKYRHGYGADFFHTYDRDFFNNAE